MSIELENKVVGAAIYQHDLVQRYELDTKWLFDKQNKLIMKVLNERDEGFSDFSELLMAIQDIDPYVALSEDRLEMLSFKFHELADYGKGVELLKIRYYKEKLMEANTRYIEEPSERNLQYLQDCMQAYEETDALEDDGSLKETVEDFMYRLENGGEDGIKSYERIDKVLGGGLRGGTLMTIGARPSVGKTAFALNMAYKMLERQADMHIDFFTLEMSKGQMLDRLLSRISNVTSYNLRQPDKRLTEEEKAKVLADALALSERSIRIYDSMYTINQIEKQIRRRVHEVGNENYIAIIDYIGLVEVGNSRMDRHLQVGEITRTLKKVTNHLHIPIIALSQLNRAVENRQDKTPNLSDLREAGSVEQDSSIVGFLHRDEDDETEVHFTIAKNREGYTAGIRYKFHGASMYFEELG